MGYNERTRKNDPYDTMLRLIIGKDIQDDEMSEATNESRKEDSTNDEYYQDSRMIQKAHQARKRS